MATPSRTEILDAYGSVTVGQGSFTFPLRQLAEAEKLCPVPLPERSPDADAAFLLGKVAGAGYPLLPEHAAFLEQATPAGP